MASDGVSTEPYVLGHPFSHLRQLPDGTLTRREVDILLSELERGAAECAALRADRQNAITEALKKVLPWVEHGRRCAAYAEDPPDEPRCTCGLGDAFAAALSPPVDDPRGEREA